MKAMESLPYSVVRANMAKTMDKVCESRKPLVITRKGGGAVVLMALEDYESMEETLYLMSSPANAQRLNEAIAEHEAAMDLLRDSVR